MQIDRIFYPVKTLGYGKRLGIWTIGCPRRCKGCSNPELWDSDPTRDISVAEVLEIARKYSEKIDGVTITGGEPFFQPEELSKLLDGLHILGIRDILVYTGYTAEELEKKPECKSALGCVGVLIDGEYMDERNDNLGIRGSSNQTIHILDEALRERYEGAEACPRRSTVMSADGRAMSVGIPIKR